MCFKTKEKRVEIPVPESSTTVTITTNSISGTALTAKEFEIQKKDICMYEVLCVYVRPLYSD